MPTATKDDVTILNDGITVVTPTGKPVDHTVRVQIMIPLGPDSDSGVKSDPYEHVTINGEPPIMIKRGEWVDVPVPVFVQLRNRYPNI